MPLVKLRRARFAGPATDENLADMRATGSGEEFSGEIHMDDQQARALNRALAAGSRIWFEVVSCGYVKPEPQPGAPPSADVNLS